MRISSRLTKLSSLLLVAIVASSVILSSLTGESAALASPNETVVPPAPEATPDPEPQPEPSEEETPPPTVTLAFVGDILLNGTVGDLIEIEGPMAPWAGVKDVLSAADFAIGNLECAVGTTGEPAPGKTWTFRADPVTLEGLKEAGIDAVSLANNHTLDFGVDCMLETVERVREAGIHTAGAGANLAAAREPVVLEKNGLTVGFLATNMIYPDISWKAGDSAPGQAIDSSRWYPEILAGIQDLSELVDIVAVYVHWSAERQEVPENWVLPVAQAMRSVGAHLVIGSHPHIMNGFDYDGRNLTAYSLGNFVFSTRPEIPRLQIGSVLEVTVSKEGVESAKVIPTRIVWGKTIVEETPVKQETLQWLSSLSNAWDTDVDEKGNILPILFTDMAGHWARQTVTELVLSGAIRGYPDGTFRPDALIPKGEFAALFARAIASDDELENTPLCEEFSLCDEASWEYLYLKYLAGRGLIPESGSSWEPSRMCARLEALNVMKKHSEQMSVAEAVYQTANLEAFTDLEGLSPESVDIASWAVATGLARGYEDGTLRLNGTVTRAEMAELLWRYKRVTLAE